MKNTSVRHPLFMEPLPRFLVLSRPERRDLRFRGPFVEMFFDRAYPDFLPRRTRKVVQNKTRNSNPAGIFEITQDRPG